MTQAPSIFPPASGTPAATAPAVVGIHFGDPLFNIVGADFMPLDSFGAACLLGRVLTLALGQDILAEEDSTLVIGTLRDGVCILTTRDSRRAIQSIREELARVALLEHCQIGIQTAAGWESVFPGPGLPLAESMDLARFKPLLAEQRAIWSARLAHYTRLRKQLPPASPGDCPPAAAQ